MIVPSIRSAYLSYPRLNHGFFTRDGGISTGVYATLNGGVGSRDDKAAVTENRRRVAETLGVEPERLLVPYQVHSNLALAVNGPWAPGAAPQVDGLATRSYGLALGVTGADCGMVLFADSQAGVVGACHSGWKGALNDVVGATVRAMVGLGADQSRIVAVLGPTIAQKSYEVGSEFVARFMAADPAFGRFFIPSNAGDRRLFDLPGFIGMRCRAAGIGRFEDMGLDTYGNEHRFYSYRRATHRGEADYGRLLAVIMLR